MHSHLINKTPKYYTLNRFDLTQKFYALNTKVLTKHSFLTSMMNQSSSYGVAN